ncbi:RiPP maturation radical SAM C-methyltransferase [Massilia rubra]|nr:RiPP maturation radical SAM C-methyltransferase [Massilia rubra]
MFPIALICMPFGAVHTPSLGLTQLKAVLDRDFSTEVQTRIHYLNHDFAEFFGLNLYRYLSDDSRTTVTGLTDWMFRDLAFPDSPDTSEHYIARYMPALACRCADGLRNKLDGCASTPNSNPAVATTVPCCLGPSLLMQLIELRSRLGDFMDELIDRYELSTARLVGFTSMFDQTTASIAMARRLKLRSPGVTTVMGGASCEPGVGRVLAKRVDAIDYTFAGPALRAFPDFVERLISNAGEPPWRIAGVHSREGMQANFPENHDRLGNEADINDRIALDYDDFLASAGRFGAAIEPELFFETSRGCWWGERAHCTFCGINGATMQFRSMSPDNAIAQFKELFEKYPQVRQFVAVDNILEPSYYEHVFPFVQTPQGASIFYETRVIDDPAQMAQLAKAGVTKIQPGLESLSTSVLKLMRKGSTAFQNINFLKRIAGHGIEVHWNLLTGFPKEDESVYAEYIRIVPALVHLPAPVATFPVRIDRHSPYQKDPGAYGLKLRPLDFYTMLYPFTEEEMEEFAYFWADQEFTNGYLFNVARWQRKIEGVVDLWRRRWFVRDGLLRPELRPSDNGRAIYDSRDGTAVEHELSALGQNMLKLLARPMSVAELHAALLTDEEEIRREIALLDERRLIFGERGRILSLVCDATDARWLPSQRENLQVQEKPMFVLPLAVERPGVHRQISNVDL